MRPPLAALLVLLSASPAGAQSPRGFEAGVAGALLLAQPEFIGGGAMLALRPGGRMRFQLAALAGDAGGLMGRGEFAVHYLVTPAATRGGSVYGVAGVALNAGSGEAGYLLLGLGLERASGASNGWWVEAGVGGGGRLAAGWRWRSLRRSPRR